MLARRLAIIGLLAIPAILPAQRKTRGDKEANWDQIGKSDGSIRLNAKDVEGMSPVKFLVDKKKDFKLTDDQLAKLKDIDAQLRERNKEALRRLDSVRVSSRPSDNPNDDDRQRMQVARRDIMMILGGVRESYDSTLKTALALLDEQQQKTATDKLADFNKDVEETLQEKMGSRGRSAGSVPASGRRRP